MKLGCYLKKLAIWLPWLYLDGRFKAPLVQNSLIRNIEWGDLNVVHTTDTHAWFNGHLLEPQFGADWGDFVSFGEYVRAIAQAENKDVIFVDTGDRHDGNGLSDASNPQGKFSQEVFLMADYDFVTVGNHELYRGVFSLDEYHEIKAAYGPRYVVSNVELFHHNEWVPMGSKFFVFTTPNQGRRLLVLGFLFDFDRNDKTISRVTRVQDEVKKPWFSEMLKNVLPEVDAVVLLCHIPLRHAVELDTLHAALRSADPRKPILILGGHSHVRDCRRFDDRAVALQSGRYLETIGWLSYSFESSEFHRRYIDFNVGSLAHHVRKSPENFKTPYGKEVLAKLLKIRDVLGLDEYLATIPRTYYMQRAPYTSENNIYTLLESCVLPLLRPQRIDRSNVSRYIIMNTGSVRFDLCEGEYTRDSSYIVSPFRNDWMYIPDMPRDIADQILPALNRGNPIFGLVKASLEHFAEGDNKLPVHALNYSLGYVTLDDLGNDGDDTPHTPWKFYHQPNAIQSQQYGANDTVVDLVFDSFVDPFIRGVLGDLGCDSLYKPRQHGGKHIVDLIPEYFTTDEL